ncbi:MAG: hypothetical protein HWE34_14090, partial [Methylocystaceae bacterium]|nr:hypothetical protein [Methylocystaceae bacterium]
MVEEHDQNQHGQEQGSDNSYDELSLDGKGFNALNDAQDNTLVNENDPLQEDAVQNANVQSTNRETFEKTIASVSVPEEVVIDEGKVEREDHKIERVDDSVDVAFANVDPSFGPEEGEAEEDELPPEEEDARSVEERELSEDEPPTFPEEVGNNDAGAPVQAANEEIVPQEDEDTEEPEEEIIEDPVYNADARELDISFNNGVEDTRLKIDLELSGNDQDGGNETTTVQIKGVPDGFSFEDGAGNTIGTLSNGIWTFTEEEVEDVYAVPTQHYSGDADWTFSVNVREAGGDTFTKEYEETLHFEAVADAPTLAADDVADMENTWIDMDITTALVDADGSESLSVYIADVPDGVS